MRKFFDNEHSVIISPSSIVFAVVFVLSLYFLYLVREIVVTLFLSVILMSALHPAVKVMERKLRFPRILSIFCLYAVIIFLLVLALVVIVPPLVAEIPNLVGALGLSTWMTISLPSLPQTLSSLHFSWAEISGVLSQVSNSLGTISDLIRLTFGSIFDFFTILVMACYLLLDRDKLHKKIIWLTRNKKYMDLTQEFIDTTEVHLGGWVRGQLFLMFTIGLIVFIGLTLLNIPYALPLALTAGLLEILPNLGPTLAALPGIVIAFTTYGWPMAVFVTLFYVVIQQLENNFIVPRIMKQNVDVNPLTTILVILTGLKIAGMMGAFLAVPAYIVIRSAYSIWLREYGNQV